MKKSKLIEVIQDLMEHYESGIDWAYTEGALEYQEYLAAKEAGKRARIVLELESKDGE